jgi:diguanylate cyclase (GGDEF)-like protein/PAS domain S-box-containing protein
MTDRPTAARPRQAAAPGSRVWTARRLEQALAALALQPLDPAQARLRVLQTVCAALQGAGAVCWELDPAGPPRCTAAWTAEPLPAKPFPAGAPAAAASAPALAAFVAGRARELTADEAGHMARQAGDPGLAFWSGAIGPAPGSELAAAAGAAGLHTCITLPLRQAGRPLAVMEFFRTQPAGTDAGADAALRRLLPAAGRQAALLLQNKQAEFERVRFRAALDLSADEIYLTDRATMRFVDVNVTACTSKGVTREQALQLGPQDLWQAGRAQIEQLFEQAIHAGPAGVRVLAANTATDGSRLVLEVHHLAQRSDDRWTILTIARDTTQRVRAEQSVQRLGRMLAALSATNEAIMRARSPEDLYQQVCDAAVDGGKFLMAAILLPDPETAAATIMAVAGPQEERLRAVRISTDPHTPEGRGLVGTAFNTRHPCVSNKFLTDERTRPWHRQAEAVGIASGAAVPFMRNGRAVGVLLFYSQHKRAFDDEVVKLLERMAANVVFGLENFEHEAERQRGRARIDYLASHDGLTGLPNRAMFSEVLGHAIDTARRYKRTFAVMFIDLDRFKLINDSLGHDAGDLLLKEMSSRLKGCLRASDVVARLGGDEFVVLVQELNEPEQAAAVARKILAAAMKPVTLLGQECRVTASVGISMFPADAQDEPGLMKNADLAMYYAKEEGKNNFQFYSHDIESQSLERLALETNLRRALERNEFSLHYQAKVDLKTGAINGVEALLRWHSAELGPVSPVQLIPVAEETGLIVPIGKWVLRTACAQNMAWQRQGLPPVCMAVNLSARQFADPFLLHDIAEVLHDTGMAPHLLELEITEGMVIQHPEKAVKLLGEIKALGVRLAIDDFGTGYSSLGQLKNFPIDTLKVDRSFIRDIPTDSDDRAITEAIIAMGKTLSLTVVAEGVENVEQETFLRQHACDEMQGYLISKPVPAPQFAELLRHRTAAAATPPQHPPERAFP